MRMDIHDPIDPKAFFVDDVSVIYVQFLARMMMEMMQTPLRGGRES